MLAYLLSLTVALGSLVVYLSAFFFPEIHRKNDFIWSGVGLFYGLVLWIFSPRITGGLLLGHVASVSLLMWFGWQTLSLRRQLVPELQQTPLPSLALIKVSFQETISKFSVRENWTKLQGFISNIFGTIKAKVEKKTTESLAKPAENTEQPQEIVTSDLSTVEEVVDVSVSSESDLKVQITNVEEVISDLPPIEEVVDVSVSSESDLEIQTTNVEEVISDLSTVEKVVDVSVSSESDLEIQTTNVEEVISDLPPIEEVILVQEVVKVNESESIKEESVASQIPLDKTTTEE
jgi:hypothetical protein